MALWSWSQPSRWFFVADTESYAGNFEREFGWFVVGRADESHLEDKDHRNESPLYKAFFRACPDDPFDDLIDTVIDDPGDDGICRSSVITVPTPGWANDGNGYCYRIATATKAQLRKHQHPAYLSVAVALTRRPTDDETRLLIERTMLFPEALKARKLYAEPLTITGCRLMEETTALSETPLMIPRIP